MFAMFDETGIFVTACRHGILLAMCDMIQSGELWVFALSSQGAGFNTIAYCI